MPSYDISQRCAYGSGGELSPSCQRLEISEKNTLESAVTVLNVVSMGFKAVGVASVTSLTAQTLLGHVVLAGCYLPWCEDKPVWRAVHQTNLGHLGIAGERLVENPFLKWICALVILINFDPLCSF